MPRFAENAKPLLEKFRNPFAGLAYLLRLRESFFKSYSKLISIL